MKVLVVCYEYPPIGGGGGRVARDVAQALAARGHEVQVQTSACRGVPAQDRTGGVTVKRNWVGRRRAEGTTILGMGFYVLFSLWPVLQAARRFRPDVIHAHFAVPSGAAAAVAARLLDIPLVITFHLGDVPGGAPGQTDSAFRWLKPLAGWIVRGARGLTGVSSFVRELAEEAFDRPATVVPNGVPGPKAAEIAVPADGPVRLVFVGRFNSQKNLGLILRAVAGLPETAAWRLELVGDGPDMAMARDLVAAYGLAGQVRFHGWISPEAVDEVMARSDMLLIPSKFEGMPVVAVSALKHGLAILGSSAPGLSDVLTNGGNGLVVPIDDEAAFRTALEEMLADRQQLMAYRRASLAMSDAFTMERIALLYEGVLQAALSVSRPQ